jgi:phage-related minor tail protein
MGEAGPEAIMPLARGADGKLGVRGGGGGTVNVMMNIQTPDARGAQARRDRRHDPAKRKAGHVQGMRI